MDSLNSHTKQIVLVFLLFISSFSGFAQKGMERKQLFDYDWKFYLGDASEAKANNFNDESWRKLDLPHDWSIEGQIQPKTQLGTRAGFSRQVLAGTAKPLKRLRNGEAKAFPFISKVFT